MVSADSLLYKAKLVRSVPILSFVAAFLIAVGIYFHTEDLTFAERGTLSVATFMVAAWMCESIPFGAIALVPAVAFPLLDISNLTSVAKNYANSTVALFFGGFLLGTAIEKSRIHQRVAHSMLIKSNLNARVALLGMIMVSSLLSMWISNTSTAMMLTPLALALGRGFSTEHSQSTGAAFALATAYGANLGGTVTILGSPPNGLLVSAASAGGYLQISFAQWLARMLPLWFILVPLAWVVLLFIFRKSFFGSSAKIPSEFCIDTTEERLKVGFPPLTKREQRVVFIFGLAVVSWLFLPHVPAFSKIQNDIDAIVALLIGLILFIIPSGDSDNEALLTWDDTRGVAWNILLLFGGGLALSNSFQSSGLSARAMGWLSSFGADGSTSSRFLIFGSILFATELISNTALAATLIPILLELESVKALSPLTLALPSTVAVSFAFMTPIATPPNAIAYGIGKVPFIKMIAAGIIMNLVCLCALVAWFS